MAEIIIYGIIGDPEIGLDAATITAAVRASTGPLTIRINSAGGDVFDGLAIYEALLTYPGTVTIYIDGLAASMASVIAMAGDEIIMAESALMMIHDPMTGSFGNAASLRSDAAKLEKVGSQLAGIYASRSGMPVSRVSRLMAAETWFTADEARAVGLATATAPQLRFAAIADISAFGFVNVPDQLKVKTMTDLIRNPDPIMPAPGLATIVPSQPATVGEVRAIVAQAALPVDFALDLIEQRLSVGGVRTAVIDRIAAQAPVITSLAPSDRTFDNPGFHAQALSDAIYCRMSGQRPEGAAAEVISLSMVDMARELIERRGVRGARRMRPEQVLAAASSGDSRYFGPVGALHTVSDFPSLLQASGQRFLLDMFGAASSAIKNVGRQRDANDFRAISVLKLSGAGTLSRVAEAGEIEHGTFDEGVEAYSLATFAKIFAISRQALINDDLGAFSDPLRRMGRGAAETEAALLASLLTANSGAGATMSDNKALFHTAHGNKAATPAGISVASLSDARQGLRAQKDTDGVTPLNGTAKYLLVGTAKETEGEQYLTRLQAQQASNVNPFPGNMSLLVDPRLPGNAWRVFADPALMPVIEYAYLNGAGGPIMETREGWNVLGTEFRVVLDFGCGAVDWRGAWLNEGD